MITAGCALDQGRDVFAVPGSIFSDRCDGTNQLLKEGAFVLTDSEDLLERLPASLRLGGFATPGRTVGDPSGEGRDPEERILDLLRAEPLDADSLSRRLGFGIQEVSIALVRLEIENRVRKENGRYRASRKVF